MRKNKVNVKFVCTSLGKGDRECDFNEGEEDSRRGCPNRKEYQCTSELAQVDALKKELERLLGEE